MTHALHELTWEFQEWCKENGLPDEGDAAHMLGTLSLSDPRRPWLTEFLTRWDNAVTSQEYPDPRDDEDWKRHAE